jgi:hypothetical protein
MVGRYTLQTPQHSLIELAHELVLQALLEGQHQEVHDRLGHQVREVFLQQVPPF